MKAAGRQEQQHFTPASGTVASPWNPKKLTKVQSREVWTAVMLEIRKLTTDVGFQGGDIVNITVADKPLPIPATGKPKRRSLAWLYRINVWRVE